MIRFSFDIFCRVVDNFGDIGVCWRLARQLAGMPQRHAVRLWVDDLRSFARIQPGVNAGVDLQNIRGVDIVHWTESPPALPAREIVIEAFACDPPAAFIESMIQRDSLWINLEYLSAESWVEGCHALPSLQANGLRKAFFFPGFTPGTGGLLREPGLLSDREDWLSDWGRQASLLGHVGLPATQIGLLRSGARQVMLFAYPNAPVQGLLDALRRSAEPAVILVPAGVCPGLPRGQHGHVHVHQIPFVDQDAFDRLLWGGSLNCVRGEDSLVRALWAGKPLLWQLYPQQEAAHLAKLDAWLGLSPLGAEAARAQTYWNTGDASLAGALDAALRGNNWREWTAASASWCDKLARQTDLAHSLIGFCTQQRRKG